MNPIISAVIPLYNAKNNIHQIVKALSEQTYLNYQVVFVDDASTDETNSVLIDMLQKVSFDYKVIRNKTNIGSGGARNVGVSNSDGKYICFIDSDDTISTIFFERIVQVIEEIEPDMIFTSAVRLYANGKTKNQYNIAKYKELKDDSRSLAAIVDCAPWGKAFKKNLWSKDNEFPLKIRGEDKATIPVLIFNSLTFGFATEAIYYYYQTPNSRSRQKGNFYHDSFVATLILASRLTDYEILEYKFISYVAYGVISNAILAKAPKKNVMNYIEYLIKNYPNAYKSKYACYINRLKLFFIKNVYKKKYWLLKLMVKVGK